MKYLLIAAAFISTSVFADQRFETVGGFCHFVTPDGFANGNDDDEVFYANCLNSIRQNNDGTGTGYVSITADYPKKEELPFSKKYSTSGNQTGVDCVMVDSNGTQYRTQNWNAFYHVQGNKVKITMTCRNAQQQ